jgi:hypothetical protein
MKKLSFNTSALADLAAAFHRRSKAIRYHGELLVTRELEDDAVERLNVDYSELSKLRLRLSAWSTGDWWFLACQRRPGRRGGWLFKHEIRGELDRRPAETIVQSFERSVIIAHWPAAEQLSRLKDVWDVS